MLKKQSTKSLCFEQKNEKYQSFLSENFRFLEMKFSICRHVFVMTRFAVLGDSFVNRLKNSTTRSNFYPFFGKSEMSTKKNIDDELHKLLHFQPEAVFMGVGGNDITSRISIQEKSNPLKGWCNIFTQQE